jgi:hypothetical protein
MTFERADLIVDIEVSQIGIARICDASYRCQKTFVAIAVSGSY